MKNHLPTKKSSGKRSQRSKGLDSVEKKLNKSALTNGASRVKEQLDQELFEHHLLGFGPCG
jgi:hypothetical protein